MIRRRFRLLLPFWIFTLLAVALTLAALASGLNLLYWMLGAMMAVLVVSGLLSGGMLRRIEIHRVLPASAVAGEPFIVRYIVRNRSGILPLLNVHVSERPQGSRRKESDEGGAAWESMMDGAPAWVMHAGPGQTVHGEAIFLPHRRGEACFGAIAWWTDFPFGLVRRTILLSQPRRLLVYPRIRTLRPELLRRLAPVGPVGTRSGRRSGPGDDFFGLRESRPGEDIRHVAWKRTAHRDHLLVIERTIPSPPRLRIVLDLREVGQEASRDSEEDAISLAASIVVAADAQGYEVGLTMLGVARSPVPVRRTLRHRARLLGALAAIDLDGPRRGGDLSLLRSGGDRDGIGLVVIAPQHADQQLTAHDAIVLSAARISQYVLDTSNERGDAAA